MAFKGPPQLRQFRAYVYLRYSQNPDMWAGDLSSMEAVSNAVQTVPEWFMDVFRQRYTVKLPPAPDVPLDAPRPWPLEADEPPMAAQPSTPKGKGKARASSTQPTPARRYDGVKRRAATVDPSSTPMRRSRRVQSRATSVASLPPTTASPVSPPGPSSSRLQSLNLPAVMLPGSYDVDMADGIVQSTSSVPSGSSLGLETAGVRELLDRSRSDTVTHGGMVPVVPGMGAPLSPFIVTNLNGLKAAPGTTYRNLKGVQPSAPCSRLPRC